MPGWTARDSFYNNLAYTPAAWIALHRICERHGLGDTLRVHYDPSHAILLGQDTRSGLPVPEGRRLRVPDRRLPRQGPGHCRQGRLGLGLRRADDRAGRLESTAGPPAGPRISATPGRNRQCLPNTNCPVRRGPIRWRISRTGPSTGSITSSLRASCSTSTSLEHPPDRRARVPGSEDPGPRRLLPVLEGSLAFVRRIDEAAACLRPAARSAAVERHSCARAGEGAYRS